MKRECFVGLCPVSNRKIEEHLRVGYTFNHQTWRSCRSSSSRWHRLCARVASAIVAWGPTTQPRSSAITAPFSLVNYGENYYKQDDTPFMSSIHAESNAMSKLPYLPRHKRPKKVDLLVIRVNKGGSMGNSKPCIHCILTLKRYLPLKGYHLDTIHYTTTNGCIISAKFSELMNEENPHMSKFYKGKNMLLKR